MSSLRFANLRIDRFLGVGRERKPIAFRKGELSPGINVVYGANGSGKTTTARALTCLVWPGTDRAEQPTLSGGFSCGDRKWDVRIDAGHARVEPDVPAGLPPSEHRDRYLLPLHDLLRARENDTRLAEIIQEEIYGGLNLGRAAQKLGFSSTVPRRTVGERRELDQARKREEETRERQRHIRDNEQHLGRLEAELRAAEAAGIRAALLQAALDCREAERQREAQEQDLQRLIAEHPGIERYRGNDAETDQISDLRSFRQIHTAIEDTARKHKAAIVAREEATRALAAAGFAGEPPTREALAEWGALVSRLGDIERDRDSADEAAAKLDQKAADTQKQRDGKQEDADRLRLDLENREPAPDTQQLGQLGARLQALTRIDEKLSEYQREVAGLEEERTRSESVWREAVAALPPADAADTPLGPPSPETVTQLLNDAEALARLERVVEAEERGVKEHRTRESNEREAIGDSLTDEQLEALDRVGMDAFEGFLTEIATLNGSQEAVGVVARWAELNKPLPEADTQRWAKATNHLEQWLAAPRQLGPSLRTATVAAALAAVAVGLAAWVHVALLVTLLAPAVLLWWAGRREEDGAKRVGIRRRYEDEDSLPLVPPMSDAPYVPQADPWSENEVRSRLARFRQSLAEARWRARWTESCRTREATEGARLEGLQAGLRERIDQIRQRLGVGPDFALESLQQLAGHICRWQEARTQLAGVEARAAEARAHHGEILQAAGARLSACGLPGCHDSNSLRTTAQLLDQVRQTGDNRRVATGAIAAKEEQANEGKGQQRKALGAINDTLTAFGLDPVESAAETKGAVDVLTQRRQLRDQDEGRLRDLVREVERLAKDTEDARGAEASERAKAEQARAENAQALAQLNASIRDFGEPPAATAADARQRVENLTSRREKWRRSKTEVDHTGREIARLAEEEEAEHQRMSDLLERFGLGDSTTGAEQRLQGLDGVHPDFTRAREERNDTAAVARERAKALSRRDDYDATLHDVLPEELRRQMEDATQQADEAETIKTQIVEIMKSVRDAREGHDLGEAVYRRTQAEAALAKRRDETFASNTGHLLIEFLRESNQANASEVLVRARERFAKITANRYDLEVADGDPPRFAARDTSTGVVRALDELSSGTRVQLLIAVRLAFLEVQEGDRPKLPLILDEALGNTDDARAPEIIDAVIEVARTGRQVFYFTAQWDEVGKWRQRLEPGDAPGTEDSAVPFAVLELPASPPPEDQISLPQTPPPQAVREPREGETYEDYGAAIGVPRFDPWADTGHTHLWYVLDDAVVLHRFLSRRIEHWGQLELLLDRAGDAAVCGRGFTDDPELARKARSAARVLSHVVALWRQGRGQPVDPDTLAADDSPFRTSKMLDDLIAASRLCGGDGEKLLEAVRDIPRFGPGRQSDLREYLEAQGRLGDASRQLTPEDLRTQLQIRLAQDLHAPDSPYAALPPTTEQELLRRTGLLQA